MEKACGEAPTVDSLARMVSAPAGSGTRALLDVVRILDATSIEPLDIGVRRATLDDVFLSLTGQGTSDQGEAQPPTGHGKRALEDITGGTR
jgi:ABC-2 type transport system ATP-binding protein